MRTILFLCLCFGTSSFAQAEKAGRPQVPNFFESAKPADTSGIDLQAAAQAETKLAPQAVSVCHLNSEKAKNHEAAGRYRLDAPESFHHCTAHGGQVEKGIPRDQALPILKQ